MSQLWEYMHLTHGTNDNEAMQLRLTALGSLGWEACGITAVDRTLGVNTVTVLLKREMAGYPPPEPATAGWYADPSGRFELRYFDGLRWVEHVSSDGTTSTDWPNVRLAAR